MTQMRLIVAGAGRRIGRTLVKAISDIKGFALAGVLEDTRSPLSGWDAGTLAGTPENGVKLTGDAAALIDKADGIVDFTAPVATVGFAELAAKSGKIHIIGTAGLSAADEARIKEAAVSGGGGRSPVGQILGRGAKFSDQNRAVSGAHPRGSWASRGPRQAAAGRRSGFNVFYAPIRHALKEASRPRATKQEIPCGFIGPNGSAARPCGAANRLLGQNYKPSPAAQRGAHPIGRFEKTRWSDRPGLQALSGATS